MSGKQEKKLRKLSRKNMSATVEHIHKTLKELVKPAPKWFPKKLWRRLAKIFLNI